MGRQSILEIDVFILKSSRFCDGRSVYNSNQNLAHVSSEYTRFWGSVIDLATKSVGAITTNHKKRCQDTCDVIGFTRREFAGREIDGSDPHPVVILTTRHPWILVGIW